MAQEEDQMPNSPKMVQVNCIVCKEEFKARRYDVQKGKGKYCKECWAKKHPNWYKAHYKNPRARVYNKIKIIYNNI
jgi:hypothetical protein